MFNHDQYTTIYNLLFTIQSTGIYVRDRHKTYMLVIGYYRAKIIMLQITTRDQTACLDGITERFHRIVVNIGLELFELDLNEWQNQEFDGNLNTKNILCWKEPF